MWWKEQYKHTDSKLYLYSNCIMIVFHTMGDINLLSSHVQKSDNNFFEEFIAFASKIIVYIFLVWLCVPLRKEGRSWGALLHLHLIQLTTEDLLTITYIAGIIIRHTRARIMKCWLYRKSSRGNYSAQVWM